MMLSNVKRGLLQKYPELFCLTGNPDTGSKSEVTLSKRSVKVMKLRFDKHIL